VSEPQYKLDPRGLRHNLDDKNDLLVNYEVGDIVTSDWYEMKGHQYRVTAKVWIGKPSRPMEMKPATGWHVNVEPLPGSPMNKYTSMWCGGWFMPVVKAKDSRFPHKCPKCKVEKAAYIGAYAFECSRGCK
jgi:hypothetical protein